MARRSVPTPAQVRGAAVGMSTATIAATAHAMAGGGLPSGPGAVQLALLGTTLGALTALVRHGDRFAVLVAVLAIGQTSGHALLGGHHHAAGDSASAGAMVAAHAIAVVAIAGLIAVGEALCRAVSRAVTAVTPGSSSPVRARTTSVLRRCEHPMRAALLLSVSWSYRGPPVSAAR